MMNRYIGKSPLMLLLRVCLLVAACLAGSATAFAPRYITHIPAAIQRAPTSIMMKKSSFDQDNGQNDFFEEAAKQGAEEVASMSIAERTKRAMLAEACEDRIVLLYDDLEELLGEDGLPSSVENRAEVEVLAREIKGLRKEYKVLVNGGQSPMLDSIDGTATDRDGQ